MHHPIILQYLIVRLHNTFTSKNPDLLQVRTSLYTKTAIEESYEAYVSARIKRYVHLSELNSEKGKKESKLFSVRKAHLKS